MKWGLSLYDKHLYEIQILRFYTQTQDGKIKYLRNYYRLRMPSRKE